MRSRVILAAFVLLYSPCFAQEVDVVPIGDKAILIPIPDGFTKVRPPIMEIDIPDGGKLTTRLLYTKLNIKDGIIGLLSAMVLTTDAAEDMTVDTTQFKRIRHYEKISHKQKFGMMQEHFRMKYPGFEMTRISQEVFADEEKYICFYEYGFTEMEGDLTGLTPEVHAVATILVDGKVLSLSFASSGESQAAIEDAGLIKGTMLWWIQEILRANETDRSGETSWTTIIDPKSLDVIVGHTNMKDGFIRMPSVFVGGVASRIQSYENRYEITDNIAGILVAVFSQTTTIENNNKEAQSYIDGFAKPDSYIEKYENGILLSVKNAVMSQFVVRGQSVTIVSESDNDSVETQIKRVKDLRREMIEKNELVSRRTK